MNNLWSVCIKEVYKSVLSTTFQKKGYRILITGQEKTKSSIAFKLAYDIANTGEYVFYICQKNKMEENTPMFVGSSDDMTESMIKFNHLYQHSHHYSYHHSVLARIQLIYVSNITELIDVINRLPIRSIKSESSCSSIVIDDLEQILSTSSSLHHSFSTHHMTIKDIQLKYRLLLFTLLEDSLQAICKHRAKDSIFHPAISLIIVDSAQDHHIRMIYPRIIDVVICNSRHSSESDEISYSLELVTMNQVSSSRIIFHVTLSSDQQRILIT